MFLSMVQWLLALLLLLGGYVAWLFSADITSAVDVFQRKNEIDRAIMHHHPQQALALAQSAVKAHPTQAYFWQKLGYASWLSSRPQEALQAYEKAYQLAPYNTALALNYARVLLKHKQVNAAIRVLGQTLQLAQQDVNTGHLWGQLALLYWQCYQAAKHDGYTVLRHRLLHLTEQCLAYGYQTARDPAPLKYIESQVWYEKQAYRTSLKSLCRLHRLPNAQPYRVYVYETMGTLLIEQLHEPSDGFALLQALLRVETPANASHHATPTHAETPRTAEGNETTEATFPPPSQRLREKYSHLRRAYYQQRPGTTALVSTAAPEAIISHVCDSLQATE